MSSRSILTFAEKIKSIKDFETSKMSMTGYAKKNARIYIKGNPQEEGFAVGWGREGRQNEI